MSSTTDGFGTFCGPLGCTDAAEGVIDHPKHGERTVCTGCAEGYEVIRRV